MTATIVFIFIIVFIFTIWSLSSSPLSASFPDSLQTLYTLWKSYGQQENSPGIKEALSQTVVSHLAGYQLSCTKNSLHLTHFGISAGKQHAFDFCRDKATTLLNFGVCDESAKCHCVISIGNIASCSTS